MKFNYDQLPTYFNDYKYFCIWGKKNCGDKRYKESQQEYKRPRSPRTLRGVGSNDLKEFTDFKTAFNKLKEVKDNYEGIGVVLSDNGLCVIDIDHITTDAQKGAVNLFIKEFGSYAEVSQSGSGVHIFFTADLQKAFTEEELKDFSRFYRNKNHVKIENGETLDMEFYKGNRSINLTGKICKNAKNEINAYNEKSLKQFLNTYFKQEKKPEKKRTKGNNKDIRNARRRINELGPKRLMELIRKSPDRRDRMFIDLYDTGDWEKYRDDRKPTESEFRWFMIHRLLYWTAIDPELSETIFRGSELYLRSEWFNRSDLDKEFIRAVAKHDPQDYFKATASRNPSILSQFLKEDGILAARYNVIKNRVEFNVEEGSSYSEIYPPQQVDLIPIELAKRYNTFHPNDKIGKKDAEDQLKLMAYKNYYNPVCDYLTLREWDGIDRFKELFSILHVTDEFDQTLIRKWFRQTTQVVFNDPSDFNTIKKTEGVLIFLGPEGIGKSSFFPRIVPNPNWVYVSGDTFNTGNKDIKSLAISNWIYCIDEIDETIEKSGSSSGSLRSFITQDMITYRKPYAENDTDNPRLCSICGTTNQLEFIDKGLFARRWWVVPLNEKIDFKRLNEFANDAVNLQQFWAQAYWEGLNLGYDLNKDERAILFERIQGNYRKEDHIESLLYYGLDFEADKEQWTWAKSSQVCKALDVGESTASKMGKTLSDLVRRGIIEKRQNKRSKTNEYLVPPAKIMENLPMSGETVNHSGLSLAVGE